MTKTIARTLLLPLLALLLSGCVWLEGSSPSEEIRPTDQEKTR